ncbi:hypothetical protein TSUD_202920 [Trifolium subterraneum]|uniref:DUF7876 domain-containing protein n=1 Tax=Trifolium subterraneum TaxID=3900 RepID=A0A2Z6M8A0_TRISU|nr:hypothetical protein TSUD_202920 [Trifolium subterraneum]
MLTIYAPRAILNCQLYQQYSAYVQQTYYSYKINNVNSVNFNPAFPKPPCGSPCSNLFHSSSFSWKYEKQQKSLHNIFHHKCLQCGLHDSISSNDEYRSSRNIAITLFKRYRNFTDRGGGDNLKEFITAGVNAYELGCTDEGLRKELTDMKDSGIEIEAMQSYGGSTSLKSKIISGETIVIPHFMIIALEELPVKTLQLEQTAVMGEAEKPSVVASRMQLIFSTLEVNSKSAVAKSIENERRSDLPLPKKFHVEQYFTLADKGNNVPDMGLL